MEAAADHRLSLGCFGKADLPDRAGGPILDYHIALLQVHKVLQQPQSSGWTDFAAHSRVRGARFGSGSHELHPSSPFLFTAGLDHVFPQKQDIGRLTLQHRLMSEEQGSAAVSQVQQSSQSAPPFPGWVGRAGFPRPREGPQRIPHAPLSSATLTQPEQCAPVMGVVIMMTASILGTAHQQDSRFTTIRRNNDCNQVAGGTGFTGLDRHVQFIS